MIHVFTNVIYLPLALPSSPAPGPSGGGGGGGGEGQKKRPGTHCVTCTHVSTFSTKYTILKLIGYFCQHVAKYSIPRSWVD